MLTTWLAQMAQSLPLRDLVMVTEVEN